MAAVDGKHVMDRALRLGPRCSPRVVVNLGDSSGESMPADFRAVQTRGSRGSIRPQEGNEVTTCLERTQLGDSS